MVSKLDAFNPIFSSENSLNVIVGIIDINNSFIGKLNKNSFATVADKNKSLNYYLKYPRLEEVPDNFKIIYNGFDNQYEFTFGDDVNLIKSAKFVTILDSKTDSVESAKSTILSNKINCKFGSGVVKKFQFIIYFSKNTGISTEYSNKGWSIENNGSLKNNLKLGIGTDDIVNELNIAKTESHKSYTLTHDNLVSNFIDIRLGTEISNNHIYICDSSKQSSDLNIRMLPPLSESAKYTGIEYYFVHYSIQNPSNSTFILLTDNSNNIQETIGLGKNQALNNIRIIWNGDTGKWITQK